MKLTSYEPLEESLAKPLPETTDDIEQVRQMVATAESYGVVLSQHRRQLLSEYEHSMKRAILQLRTGEVVDESGDTPILKRDKALAEQYAKLTADEKKVFFNAEVAEKAAELEYVKQLEELVKRRCSFGQSLMNSFNIEQQSSWNK